MLVFWLERLRRIEHIFCFANVYNCLLYKTLQNVTGYAFYDRTRKHTCCLKTKDAFIIRIVNLAEFVPIALSQDMNAIC